ncbi:MAG: PhoH family protein [Spirochaetes bacterium]|nr:PhoH family protein [Spirochaetota bacterium]
MAKLKNNNLNEPKYFIIDTNVLLHYPYAMDSFLDNYVIIPIKVLEELDKFKKERTEIGKNAREVSRILDNYRKKGSLKEGVKTQAGGKIFVSMEISKEVPKQLSFFIADDQILLCAKYYKDIGKRVFFVSKDINARIKADSLGIKAVDYEKQKTNYSTIYTGYIDIYVSKEFIDNFYLNKSTIIDKQLFPNQYVCFIDKENIKHTALGRYDFQNKNIKLINSSEFVASGIKPLNKEQIFAFDLLLDDNVKLVNLIGKAGTGKTLIALAVALKKIFEKGIYKKLLVARPVIPMGKDIGYLPGTKEEKLINWMQPIYDNLEFLFSLYDDKTKPNEKIKSLISTGILEIEALTYIRGRSIPEQFIIIDEAQNLTPLEVKTIISRAGEGTKIVLTGDPQQIDNPYLDEDSNGLTYVVDRLKDSELTGSILLVKTERSSLASLAAEKL